MTTVAAYNTTEHETKYDVQQVAWHYEEKAFFVVNGDEWAMNGEAYTLPLKETKPTYEAIVAAYYMHLAISNQNKSTFNQGSIEGLIKDLNYYYNSAQKVRVAVNRAFEAFVKAVAAQKQISIPDAMAMVTPCKGLRVLTSKNDVVSDFTDLNNLMSLSSQAAEAS